MSDSESARMTVRRSSPNFSRASSSSLTIIASIFFGSASIALYSFIFSRSSANSASTLSRSRPVSCARRMSRMALACSSLRPNSSCRRKLAVSRSLLARITAMTSSSLSSAIFRPSKMCARSSAILRSKRVRFVTTTRRCSTNSARMRRRSITRGAPLRMESMIIPKLTCSGVDL